jgi:hypothetical protein
VSVSLSSVFAQIVQHQFVLDIPECYWSPLLPLTEPMSPLSPLSVFIKGSKFNPRWKKRNIAIQRTKKVSTWSGWWGRVGNTPAALLHDQLHISITALEQTFSLSILDSNSFAVHHFLLDL